MGGARWLKLWKGSDEIKYWQISDVLDVGFKVSPEGTGVLNVTVKAFTEWGFAVESYPWTDDCELRFS